MDVFAFGNELVVESERFSRSFTTIRAEDIHQAVDEAYTGGRFRPTPLIQLNPTSYGLPPAAPLPARSSSLRSLTCRLNQSNICLTVYPQGLSRMKMDWMGS